MSDLTTVWTEIETSMEQAGYCLHKALTSEDETLEMALLIQSRERLASAIKCCHQAVQLSKELEAALEETATDNIADDMHQQNTIHQVPDEQPQQSVAQDGLGGTQHTDGQQQQPSIQLQPSRSSQEPQPLSNSLQPSSPLHHQQPSIVQNEIAANRAQQSTNAQPDRQIHHQEEQQQPTTHNNQQSQDQQQQALQWQVDDIHSMYPANAEVPSPSQPADHQGVSVDSSEMRQQSQQQPLQSVSQQPPVDATHPTAGGQQVIVKMEQD